MRGSRLTDCRGSTVIVELADIGSGWGYWTILELLFDGGVVSNAASPRPLHALGKSYQYDTIMLMNDTISERQLRILRRLNQVANASRQELESAVPGVSRITLIRDLNRLSSLGLVFVTGRGPSTTYSITSKARQLKLYDPAVYLREEPDSRGAQFTAFETELLKGLGGSLAAQDLSRIERVVAVYRSRQNSDVAERELERFIIELSWKSSKIEGNTYTLLDTEQLIKGSVEAAGHSREEAVMILNHKAAFDYIWQHQSDYKQLTRAAVEDVHQLLTHDLGITPGLRRSPVGITGTAYTPPASQVELVSHLDQLVGLVNSSREPAVKGLVALAGLSYLQPFADGNKRTARLISNALLVAYDYPPLSYRTVDENAFKGALILFYEQGVADYIGELFIQQLEFSAGNYNL